MCENTFCQNCKNKLLEIANNAIISYLTMRQKLVIDVSKLPKVLTKPKGNFVTVEVNNQLRGCIGKIETKEPLYQDIIDNAIEAAFYDWRFEPLTKEDLAGLKIEISLLTKPKKLNIQEPEKILEHLVKEKPGVILQKGIHKATFLPQVWEKINQPLDFLEQLSIKAGMDDDGWKSSEIFIYKTETI